MPGKLTTHILDTAHGCPAANMRITLWFLDPGFEQRILLKKLITNAEGRTDEPLLDTTEFKTGIYELVFEVGSYFQSRGTILPQPAFLDQVPLRFGIADPMISCHLPLFISPWGYTVYRSS
jgi:5-hydroxyisourate hydrolase